MAMLLSVLFVGDRPAEGQWGLGDQFRMLPVVIADGADVVDRPHTLAHNKAVGFAALVTPGTV